MDRAVDMLADAQQILEERGKQYGDARILFQNIAVRFSLVLGHPVTPYEAARLLAELKMARLDLKYQTDSILDGMNYFALAGALSNGQEE